MTEQTEKFTPRDGKPTDLNESITTLYEKQEQSGEITGDYVIIPVSDLETIEGEDDVEYADDYNVLSHTEQISFVELAVINSFFYQSFINKANGSIVSVKSYGHADSSGRINFGGAFNNADAYWFMFTFNDEPEFVYIVQTKVYVNTQNEYVVNLHVTSKQSQPHSKFREVFKKIKSLAFNNSEFKGKCIKVKVHEQRFKGIEIISLTTNNNELILTTTQRKYLEHFINRVKRGGSARYLLNGEPGTGKTESIRQAAVELMPEVTFIIPDFTSTDDLQTIMEACEIFDKSVIIMDDIDLFLGSRENGSYTRLLGQFLAFFDGVKKRKISLLASTNDKGLVDKAAERPGRFNMTIDYGFLNEEQIVKVCQIHLPEKWQIKEVYDALVGKINGKEVKITGAFIANLADNIKEMTEDDENWSAEDTVSLIQESYKGFYTSQVEKERKALGFNPVQQ